MSSPCNSCFWGAPMEDPNGDVWCASYSAWMRPYQPDCAMRDWRPAGDRARATLEVTPIQVDHDANTAAP